MLNVIVLGNGLIPRGFGIAPRKTPFGVDVKTLKIFTETPWIETYAINPSTGAKVLLNPTNYEKTYNAWADEYYVKPAPAPKVTPTPVTKPYVPQPKKEEPRKEEVKVEQPAPVETKEEPKEETPVIPVIQNPNNQNQNKSKNKN